MRYIDAEALTDHMLERYNELCEKYGDWDHYATGYGDAIDAIENAPEADVVPKSEVDHLKDDNKFLQDRRFKELSYVRQEVAREIFEEIEEALFNNHDLDLHSDYPTPHYYEELKDDIAELKKKYTEGE